jgi:hypothetical protein
LFSDDSAVDALAVLLEYRPRVPFSGVINDNEFDRTVALLEDALNRLTEEVVSIMSGDDDQYLPGHALPCTYPYFALTFPPATEPLTGRYEYGSPMVG